MNRVHFYENYGNPIFKRVKRVPITRTPEYHYIGDVKSYDEMLEMLKRLLSSLHTKYKPMSFHRSININAGYIFAKGS